MFALDLPLGLFLLLHPLKSLKLLLREDQVFLRHLHFERLQTLLERLKIAPLPKGPYPCRGYEYPSYPQLVGHSGLPIVRLLNCKGTYRFLNGGVNSVP